MIAAVLQGLALGLMLSISGGTVILTILKQSINNGHKGGFAFIAGVSAIFLPRYLMTFLIIKP
jgi:threonine/homoserine/homoserine lactone efflux protein